MLAAETIEVRAGASERWLPRFLSLSLSLPLPLPLCLSLFASACVNASGGGGGGTGGGFVAADSNGPAAVFKPDAGSAVADTAKAKDTGGPFTEPADVPTNQDAALEDSQEPAEVAVVDAAPDAKSDAKTDAADAKSDTADAKADAKADVKAETVTNICGDGTCAPPETCTDCPQDCGNCAADCGNGTCEDGETCDNCPNDCVCGPVCGDKKCDAGSEDCKSCPGDCGPCPPVCGNGTCEAGESASSCPKDCQTAPKCGDKLCNGTETCSTCPGDCGACGVCNTITNAQCKPTEQCYPVQTGNPVCSTPGTVAAGKVCNALADCTLGCLCVDGVCSKVCDSTGATPGYTCAAPASCVQLSVNGTPLANNVGVCMGGATCNLVSNSGCGAGLVCVTAGTGKACVKAGAGGSGSSCMGAADCAATHVCVTDATNKKACVQKCDALTKLPKCSTGLCQGLSYGNPPKSAPDNLGGCF